MLRIARILRNVLKLRQLPANLRDVFLRESRFKIVAITGDDLIQPRWRNDVVMSEEGAAQTGKIRRLINAPPQHRIPAIRMEQMNSGWIAGIVLLTPGD
ncbi:hypothetical protein D3C77_553950 [compost metagenome]